MRNDAPEVQFGKIKKFTRVAAIAPIVSFSLVAVILILESLPADLYNSLHAALPLHFIDWLYLCILLLLAVTIVPAIMLFTQPVLRQIHLAVRQEVVYRYLLYAWLVFFASRLLVSIYHAIYWFPEVVVRNLVLGILLKAFFLFMQRRYIEKPETMFP
jgi:hypothetical protein